MNRAISRTCLLILLVAFAAVAMHSAKANAGQADLSWDHPTAYVDGTALPLAQIEYTEVRYGVCNATKTAFATTPAPVSVTVPAPAAARVISNLGAGSWCFQVRTKATTTAELSDWTALVFKDIVAPRPAPPANLRVANTVAYTVVKAVDRFVLLPVGSVPADTVCSTTQSVNGYYVVPRAAVTWTGSVRPDVVVAQCS